MAGLIKPSGTRTGLKVGDKIRIMWTLTGGYEELGEVTAVTPNGEATHAIPVLGGMADYERTVRWDEKWSRYQEV